jgi:hypothetical protein
MRRFVVGLSLTLITALAVGCSSDRATAPMAPPAASSVLAHASALAVACPRLDSTAKDIPLLSRPPQSIIALAEWLDALVLYKTGHTAAARTEMFKLWGQALSAYHSGTLIGGMSMKTANLLLSFGTGLYCDVGLDPTGLTLGADPTNPANVTVVVFPAPDTQTVTTNDGQAAVKISPKAITQPVTITISYITTQFPAFSGPLDTPLDQYGPFFQYTVTPEQPFSDTVVVEACITGPSGSVPPAVHIGHNIASTGTGGVPDTVVQILPKAPANLTCTGSGTSMRPAAHGLFQLAAAYGSRVLSWFTPTPAYAGTLGLGGKTKSFSPFGGVDSTVVVVPQPNPFPNQTVPTGSATPVSPAVLLTTPNARPVPGANVTFATTVGQGDLTAPGSPTQSPTVVVTTGANGVAAVGSWIVGPGANTVTATTVFPVPAGSVGVTVLGATPTYQATGTDIMPFIDSSGFSNGYSYLLFNPNAQISPSVDTVGFQTVTLTGSSQLPAGWITGASAPFGSGSVSQVCPLDQYVQSLVWNTSGDGQTNPSVLLAVRPFGLPASYTGSIQISVAIDNDIILYLNGVALSPTNGAQPNPNDFNYYSHEGCATEGSFTYAVPNSALHLGGTPNVLAVRAQDRGEIGYLDVQIVPAP